MPAWKVSRNTNRLQELSLNHTKLTDDGLERLRDVKSLKKLSIKGTEATDKGIAELKRACPGLGSGTLTNRLRWHLEGLPAKVGSL